MNIHIKRSFSFLPAIFALVFSVQASFAITWVVPSGTWTTGSNWSSGAVPNSATPAIIDNSGTAFITKGSAKASTLFLGFTSPTPTPAPSPLPTPTPSANPPGMGALNMTGGKLTVDSTVLGNATGSVGTVDINNGKWTNNNQLIVGNSGSGAVSMAGGTLSDSNAFLGKLSGSTGSFTMSGGSWKNDTGLTVGEAGTGILTIQSKATVSIATGDKVLNLAAASGSTGTLNMGAGNLVGNLQVSEVRGGGGTATVNFNHTGSYTFSPILSGSLSVRNIGSGITILTGNNTYLGTTTVTQGTLQIGSGGSSGTLGAGAVTIGSLGTLTFDRSGTMTVANNISGAGALQHIGSGTTILSGTNTYSGGTTIKKGSLQIDSNARLGSGTLTVDGGGITFGASISDLRALTIGTGGATLNTNGFSVLYSAGLTGNGSLTKAGLGSLVLTGINTYTGTTTISGGTLQVGLGMASSNLSAGKIVNNGILIYDLPAPFTLGNVMSGKGQFQSVGGNLTLTGANSYSGGTFIQHNQLTLGNAKALGAASGDLNITTGGSLDLNGYSVTVGALSGSYFSAISSSTANAVTLTTNSSTDSTFTGALTNGTGTLALVKSGKGTLTLDGPNNSYSGGTTLKGGGVNINNDTALGTGAITIAGTVVLDNTSGSLVTLDNVQNWNANFTFLGTNDLNLGVENVFMSGSRTVTVDDGTLTVGGVISGSTTSSGLTKAGDGTLLLVNNNTYAGSTTIKAGTLQIGNGGTVGSIVSTKIIDDGKISYDRNDLGPIAIDAVISGKGAVQQMGAGTLVLAGTNSYTGGTLITNGILQAGNAKALGNGSLLVSSAQFDLNGFSVGVTSIFGNPDAEITNNGVIPSVLTSTSSTSTTYAGTITDGSIGGGSVALVLDGKGTLELLGPDDNTYSGGTTLKDGELDLGKATAIGTGTLTIAGGTLDNTTGGALTLTNNNAQQWDGNFTFKGTDDLNLGTGDVALSGTRSVTVNAGTLTVGGDISGTNTSAGLTKAGAGTLILDGNNTYAGTTTISAGTLQIGEGGTVNTLSTKAFVNNGSLIFDTSSDLYYRGVISGKGSVTQNGSGLIALSGVNSYSGGTTVNGGTLRVLNFKALGSTSGSLTIAAGAVLEMNTGAIEVGTLSGAGILSNFGAQAGTFTTTSSVNSLFSGQILDTAPGEDPAAPLTFVKGGNGTLTLTGTNTYTGGTTINAGKLQLGNGGTTGTIVGDVVDNGILAFNYSSNKIFDGVISGKGSVQQVGVGSTLTLTANNTYTGGTTIGTGASLRVVDGGSFSTGNVSDSGALIFDYDSNTTVANTITGSGRIQQDGDAAVTLSGSNSFTGGTTINAGVIFLGNAKGLGSTSGNLALNGGSLDLNGFSLTVGAFSGTGADASIINTSSSTKAVALTTNTTANTTYAGSIQNGNSSTTALVKSGNSTLTLTGENIYTGGTTINAGTVQIGNGGTTGSIAGNVLTKGTIAFSRSDTYEFDGQVSGTGSVAQAGPGTLVLRGNNTHSGGTVLQGGTLEVGSSTALGTGSLTLTAGTLATDGVQTRINVNGALNWNSNAKIALTLTPDSSSEEVIVGGSLLTSGNGQLFFNFTPSGLTLGNHYDFLVMTVGQGFGQLTPGNFNFISSDPDLEGNFRITGNQLWFDDGYGDTEPPGDSGSPMDFGSPQPVPEPSTYALFALGALILLVWRPLRRAGFGLNR